MDNRYYGSYRRFTFDFDYEDQEEYTRYEEELDNLELKEVVADEEYNNNVSRLEATNDMEELERYRNNNVSESEYYFTKDELVSGMNEIETRYRVTEEMKQEDRAMRARYTRDRLKMIKRTYESRGINNTVSNLNVDNLSDEEVISMYAYATHGKTQEEVRELELGAIRDRVGNNSTAAPTPTVVDDSENITSNEIEIELGKFREKSDRINDQLKEMDKKLVLGDENDLDVTEAINGLDSEIKELREMASVILSDMDSFRLSTESADFSMSPSEIKKTVDGFTKRFKELKIKHQEKYNARVEYTNNKIDELKALNVEDEEVKAMIDSLTKLDRSDNVIKSWNQTNYLKNIDYNKLVEVNKMIAEIQNRLGVKKTPTDSGVEGLEAEVSEIERVLSSVEAELETELSDERINELNQDLSLTGNSINDFRQKLEFNKDKLTEEEYNNYKKRADDAETKLNELRGKLGKGVTYSNDYKELEGKVNELSADVDRLDLDIEALHGHITEGGKLVFEGRVNTLEGRLNELVTEVESKKDSMDENQYNSLMDKVTRMQEKLENTKDKVKDPGMIKGTDIYAVLNGEIDGLEQALTNLETQIDKLEKPIKREDRKNIDTIVKHLEKEINRLSKLVEQYKENDPEKYNSTVERLNNLKDRLDKVGKEYRKKCPLMVKAVKSAKNFFKKHKKACLIIAGLAAMALVSHHVLIPALMHGNIMIAGTTPALRPFIKFTNNILGGMINASKVLVKIGDASQALCWRLANGAIINPSCAASSLLKGLAISGISSTALVAPLVVAIKKLVEKMKTVELKQKLSEGLEKGKNSVNTLTGNVKDKMKKVKKEKNPNKKAQLITEKELTKLLIDYRRSGASSVDEYLSTHELSEDEINILKSYEVILNKNIEENTSRKRGK